LAGRAEQAKLTGLLNPPDGVMVMVEVVVLPWFTLPLAGLSETLKSAGAAVTVTVTGDEVEVAKLASPPSAAVIEYAPTASLLVE